jgi:hypothetical protein
MILKNDTAPSSVYAILNITQLQILFEEPLFQVEYYE